MKRIIYLLVAAIGLLVGCTPEEETWVQAGFTLSLIHISEPTRPY